MRITQECSLPWIMFWEKVCGKVSNILHNFFLAPIITNHCNWFKMSVAIWSFAWGKLFAPDFYPRTVHAYIVLHTLRSNFFSFFLLFYCPVINMQAIQHMWFVSAPMAHLVRGGVKAVNMLFVVAWNPVGKGGCFFFVPQTLYCFSILCG